MNTVYKIQMRTVIGNQKGRWCDVSCGKKYNSIRRVLQAIRNMRQDLSWREYNPSNGEGIRYSFEFIPVHYYKQK